MAWAGFSVASRGEGLVSHNVSSSRGIFIGSNILMRVVSRMEESGAQQSPAPSSTCESSEDTGASCHRAALGPRRRQAASPPARPAGVYTRIRRLRGERSRDQPLPPPPTPNPGTNRSVPRSWKPPLSFPPSPTSASGRLLWESAAGRELDHREPPCAAVAPGPARSRGPKGGAGGVRA